jgi:hypothetical protein
MLTNCIRSDESITTTHPTQNLSFVEQASNRIDGTPFQENGLDDQFLSQQSTSSFY